MHLMSTYFKKYHREAIKKGRGHESIYPSKVIHISSLVIFKFFFSVMIKQNIIPFSLLVQQSISPQHLAWRARNSWACVGIVDTSKGLNEQCRLFFSFAFTFFNSSETTEMVRQEQIKQVISFLSKSTEPQSKSVCPEH